MSALVLLAPGFEEIEAITVIDILRRAEIETVVAGLVLGPIVAARQTQHLADVALADWVEETFRSVKLFYTSGHVTATAVAFLMKQILSRCSILSPALARAAIGEVDILLRRHTGQDFECVPIHPMVAGRLNLRFFDPNATYRWHAHDWTFREYILHYIRWADYLK